jgi:hypothetical protein
LRSVFFGPQSGGAPTQRPADFQDARNPADHPPIVDTLLAPRIGRKPPHDLRKLLVRQPGLVLIHQRLLSKP